MSRNMLHVHISPVNRRCYVSLHSKYINVVQLQGHVFRVHQRTRNMLAIAGFLLFPQILTLACKRFHMVDLVLN